MPAIAAIEPDVETLTNFSDRPFHQGLGGAAFTAQANPQDAGMPLHLGNGGLGGEAALDRANPDPSLGIRWLLGLQGRHIRPAKVEGMVSGKVRLPQLASRFLDHLNGLAVGDRAGNAGPITCAFPPPQRMPQHIDSRAGLDNWRLR